VADFIAACVGKATEGCDGGALDIEKLIQNAEKYSSEAAETIVCESVGEAYLFVYISM
jgi:hypothetical protein